MKNNKLEKLPKSILKLSLLDYIILDGNPVLNEVDPIACKLLNRLNDKEIKIQELLLKMKQKNIISKNNHTRDTLDYD